MSHFGHPPAGKWAKKRGNTLPPPTDTFRDVEIHILAPMIRSATQKYASAAHGCVPRCRNTHTWLTDGLCRATMRIFGARMAFAGQQYASLAHGRALQGNNTYLWPTDGLCRATIRIFGPRMGFAGQQYVSLARGWALLLFNVGKFGADCRRYPRPGRFENYFCGAVAGT
jgi:hypothetical protein